METMTDDSTVSAEYADLECIIEEYNPEIHMQKLLKPMCVFYEKVMDLVGNWRL